MTERMVVEKIESIRKSKGVTKTFIANRCGHSPNWYWKVESGKSRLKVEELHRIAQALDVDPGIFFSIN